MEENSTSSRDTHLKERVMLQFHFYLINLHTIYATE